jgi:hypothetical protein
MELSDLEAVYAYIKSIPVRKGVADKLTRDYARWCAAATDCEAGETCNTATSECIGAPCTLAKEAEECAACQTCTASGNTKCDAPASASTCPVQGI